MAFRKWQNRLKSPSLIFPCRSADPAAAEPSVFRRRVAIKRHVKK